MIKRAKKALIPISLIAYWVCCLVLPHFQGERNLLFILFDLALVGYAYLAILYISKENLFSSKIFRFLLATLFSTIPILQLLAILGHDFPYRLFSRFGSYTMFQDGKVVLFGDLIHITSAAQCQTKVKVGEVLCDPWGRELNQNSQIIEFFRFLNFTNHELIGVVATILMLLTLYSLIKRVEAFDLITFLAVLSPPMILAIDRGNEVITLTLILLAALLVERRYGYSIRAHIALALATLFKIWPFVLSITFGLLQRRKPLIPFLIAFSVSVYLFFRRDEILALKRSTQSGDITGNSFGVGLFDFKNSYDLVVTGLGILVALLFLRSWKVGLALNPMRQQDILILGLLLSYVVLWFSGSHFAYRLVVLVPLIILTRKFQGVEPLRVFMALSMLSARLPIGPLLTTSLVVIFSVIILRQFQMRLKGVL